LTEKCLVEQGRRNLLLVIHQLFLENPSLIKQFYEQYEVPIPLIPWLVELVPSLHVLLDTIHQELKRATDVQNLLTPGREWKPHRLVLGHELAMKYPTVRAQEVCSLIIDQCAMHITSDPVTSLQITICCLKAFPTLMEKVLPLVLTWSQQFSTNEMFMAAAAECATTLQEINRKIAVPIYRRSITLPPLKQKVTHRA
jgi:hypothetical protein